MSNLILPMETAFETFADWQAWRKDGIGASLAAQALGVSPYGTPYSAFLEKTGRLPQQRENFAMKLGKLYEPVIAAMYEDETGKNIVRREVCAVYPPAHFIRATIDGIDQDGEIVEFKTASRRLADQWGEPGTDQIPRQYLVQAHQQMLVADKPKCTVAALIGGDDFRLYTVERDSEIDSMLIRRLTDFWDMVQHDVAPEITEADAEVIIRMRPTIQATIELDDRAVALANLFGELKDRVKMDEARLKSLQCEMIKLMEGHALADLPDGRRFRRAVVNKREHVQKACTYTTFSVVKKKGENNGQD